MLASAAPSEQTEEIVKDEADTETHETVKEATEDEPEEIDEVVTVEEESAAEPEDEPVAETEQEPVELTVASTYELQTGSFSYTFKNSAPATLGEILIANGIALPANVGACWTGDMGKISIEKNGSTIQDGLVDDYTITPLMTFDSAVFYAGCAGVQVTFRLSNPDAAPVEEETTPAEEEIEETSNQCFADILKRPAIYYKDLEDIDDETRPALTENEKTEVEVILKYDGYIRKQINEVEKLRSLEDKKLSETLDYHSIGGLRLEARQKLSDIRPITVGQASRISGVSPADINVLLVYLEKEMRSKN